MISGHVIASRMARAATERGLAEPPRPRTPRRPRRATAILLQHAAHRLDPCVSPPPRVSAGT